MKELKKKRILAVVIDLLIACLIIWMVETIINFIVAPTPPSAIFSGVQAITFSLYWFICKDCYKGMSFGKRIMGIQVINSKNLRIASPLRCVIRGFCSYFGLIELIVLLSNSQGVRIGDYLASTKVVLRNPELQQKHGSAVFTFIIFFVIWVTGAVIDYLRLKGGIAFV